MGRESSEAFEDMGREGEADIKEYPWLTLSCIDMTEGEWCFSYGIGDITPADDDTLINLIEEFGGPICQNN